jgi:hypothetical protein
MMASALSSASQPDDFCGDMFFRAVIKTITPLESFSSSFIEQRLKQHPQKAFALRVIRPSALVLQMARWERSHP